ncbi:hypothetical protein OLMES_2020 [Oleiphilus messinensis]|uniref:Transmembrane protein (PGPGW) n=1 Tax=Oleiphilus messinensis TaxID=141451 RepID=A0A1Y0I9M6_9GAMM|nr:hypothetical protein [Oleiphilus messinensis]ARU56093.1 hypothetical protein OLMES_2020 [Oleiphilus messinensis]
MVKHVSTIILAWLLIIAGLIVLPLPIPLGLVMIVVGAALLAGSSPAFRRYIQRVRLRNPKIDKKIKRFQHRLPAWLRERLISTEPK